MRVRKRKWVYFLVGPLPQIAAYVGGPLVIARRDRRRGWRNGLPGWPNLLGVVPLVAGGTVLGAAIASHYRASPQQMKIGFVPDYLATGGIYKQTRNPMYVGGFLMQTGWVLLLGSTRMALTAAAYLAGMDFLGIPFEERLLHRRFGDSYNRYRQAVPRWLRMPASWRGECPSPLAGPWSSVGRSRGS